jgi:hypothetical protein
MISIIQRNGYLIVTGEESPAELRTALLYLRQHTYVKCWHPDSGVPIESLLPDIGVLTVRSTRSKNAPTQSVTTKDERL